MPGNQIELMDRLNKAMDIYSDPGMTPVLGASWEILEGSCNTQPGGEAMSAQDSFLQHVVKSQLLESLTPGRVLGNPEGSL